jgi:hypoxanthine-DNA glycosylase
MGEVFGAEPVLPYAERVQRLVDRRVALWDVCAIATRRGSTDAEIRSSRFDRTTLLNSSSCMVAIEIICFNGGKAAELFRRHVSPTLELSASAIPHAVLSSTSPAHAAVSFENKLANGGRRCRGGQPNACRDRGHCTRSTTSAARSRFLMTITNALPTADAVLQFEPEDLAPYLLEHLATNRDHLHPGNFFNASVGTTVMGHYKNDERVEHALREAWWWLEREGLIVRKEYGYFISRRGQRLRTRHDFDAFRRSNVLPKASLHPVIAERVWANFIRGDYDTAVFQAFKEVEVAVRAAGNFTSDDVGIKLMAKAFKVGVGPLADTSLPEAEQHAMVSLFTGAIGLFKNPSSHRHVALNDPSEAAEMISFASLLMRVVDSGSPKDTGTV